MSAEEVIFRFAFLVFAAWWFLLAERAAREGWGGERFETEQRRVLDGRAA